MKTHIAWRKLAQLGPFHWRDGAPRRAARVALGVVLPLGLGWVSGHVDYGAYAALGANFSAKETVDLTVMIGMINLWNRLTVGVRAHHPVAAAA